MLWFSELFLPALFNLNYFSNSEASIAEDSDDEFPYEAVPIDDDFASGRCVKTS